jgi:ribosomal protein S18 acetylase RimI-like enzyme
MLSVGISSLGSGDVESAADVMYRAFEDDPAWSLILTDPRMRERTYRRMWPAIARYASRYGVARGFDGTAGVACWLVPGHTKVTAFRSLLSGFWTTMLGVDSATRKEFMAVLGELDEVHERLMTQPHMYLWALATDPERQGEGIGSQLLEDGVQLADGHPLYLEAITEQNAAFYEHRGFKVVESGLIGSSGFPYWSMVRHPE